MHAASRESYEAGVRCLEAFDADAAALAAIANGVLAVADLLRREPRLRRALADPARSGEDRVELLRGVLGDRVDADPLELTAALVAGRWSTPGELLDATERLGVDALLASAEQAGTLGEVEDELFRFGQLVDADQRLALALDDSTVPPARRATLVRSLLDGKANPASVRLAELALTGFGGRSFAGSLSRLVELAAERRKRRVAYVTAAAPLTEEEERRLGARLSELYGREVSLKIAIEPEILGGMRVQVGHDLFDGSVARRLAETSTALAGR